MVPSFIPKDERHSVDLPRRQPPAPLRHASQGFFEFCILSLLAQMLETQKAWQSPHNAVKHDPEPQKPAVRN
jgi:hypothetical protein